MSKKNKEQKNYHTSLIKQCRPQLKARSVSMLQTVFVNEYSLRLEEKTKKVSL